MKGFEHVERGIYRRLGVYYVAFADESGRMVYRSTKQGSLRAAREILGRHKTEVALAVNFPNRRFEKVKFADLESAWWQRHGSKTRSGFEYLRPRIKERFGKHKARDVTSDLVQDFLDELEKSGLSASSVNHHRTILNSIFNFALSRKPPLYDENPVRGVRQFREPPGRERFLTVGEFRSILTACEDDVELKAAIIVLSTTTLRKGELIQRRWSDMHLDDAVPYVSVPHTKTGYSKKVPLAEVAVCALKLLPSYDRDDFVFPSRPTARWPNPKKPWRWDFGKEFREACKKAKLQNVRLHDLRHLGTSVLTEQGIPPEVIRKITGHRSDELDRYQHLSDRLKRQTVDLIAEVLFQMPQESGSDGSTTEVVS